MYGLSWPGFISNHSGVCSCSTTGANGRKLSRNLIFRFIVACIAGDARVTQDAAAPSARGPNSIRPWNQPTIFPSASRAGDASSSSDSSLEALDAGARPTRLSENRATWSVVKLGPRKLPCWRRGPRAGAAFPVADARRTGPPQGAAGIAGGRLDPDVLERPFAEQSAVGDAVQGHAAGQDQVLQARPGMHVAADPQHGLLGHRLNAGRQIHVPLLQRRLGPPRRAAEEAWKRRLVIVSPWQ